MKISDTHDVNLILEFTPEHHDFLVKRHDSVQSEPLPSHFIFNYMNKI